MPGWASSVILTQAYNYLLGSCFLCLWVLSWTLLQSSNTSFQRQGLAPPKVRENWHTTTLCVCLVYYRTVNYYGEQITSTIIMYAQYELWPLHLHDADPVICPGPGKVPCNCDCFKLGPACLAQVVELTIMFVSYALTHYSFCVCTFSVSSCGQYQKITF